MLIFFPPWNAYAVSHHVQRKLQPVSRTNTHGKPARVPSPCTYLNISLMNIAVASVCLFYCGVRGTGLLLAAPAKPPNPAKENDHRSHQPYIPGRHANVAKHNQVTNRNQHCGNQNDQKAAIHRVTSSAGTARSTYRFPTPSLR